MLFKSPIKTGRSISILTGIALVAALGATTYASNGLVQDRRVNLAQANAMAARAQTDTAFPIVVNDLVLTQLNRYIGTPEGREYMKNALSRMENYKEIISQYANEYGVPREILAIPMIESGYLNMTEEQGNNPVRTAGLWQFIPSTARNFGLHVDDQKDERVDVKLSTDAAIRLLQSDKLRFKDWHLSILAYNMGEEGVQKGITATGTRDAWTLIRQGYEGDKDYLPKFMAAVLIMKNPESVE